MFDRSYSKYYERFHYNKDYKREIDFVVSWAFNPNSILDIGCGTAHYWKYFVPGTFIRGLESSYEMIKRSDYKTKINLFDVTMLKPEMFTNYECVTALFNVVNYIPTQRWWRALPLASGGHFIFDTYDKKKVDKDGFKTTVRKFGQAVQTITPVSYENGKVILDIKVEDGDLVTKETHTMYIFSEDEIREFCGELYEIEEVKKTKRWQTWYKLRRK